MHYDDVFHYIGQFGRYQKFLYLLICMPQIFSAIQTLLSVFILHVPSHSCIYGDVTKPIDIPLHLPNMHTTDETKNTTIQHRSKCEFVEKVGNVSNIEYEDIFSNITKSYHCIQWEYDQTYFEMTFAMQKNLVCDRKADTTLAIMLYMAGFTVGSLLTGIVSDAFGRKKTLMCCIVLITIPNIAMSFVSNFEAFGVLRFISGFSVGGLLGSGYVLGVEMVGPEKRIWAGIIFEFFWAAGEMLLALLAYFIRNWKYLNLVVSIPPVLFFSYFWILPESPRWLLVKGRSKEAEEVLQTTARINKTEIPDNIFENHKLETNQTIPIWNVCKHPTLLLETLVIVYDWMMASMVFYGLGMNSGNLGGSIYLNFFMQSLAEVFGFAGCIALLHKTGRKPVFIVSIGLSGLACLTTIVPVICLGPEFHWLTLILATIGKIGASSAFAVLFLYSGEIFPTVIRNTALGIGTFFARAGGMAAPYIVDMVLHIEGEIGKAIPLVIFGVSSVLAGLFSFYLPETRNKDLPESIEDWLNYNKEYNSNNKDQTKDFELKEAKLEMEPFI